MGIQWIVGALMYGFHPLALLAALHVLPDVPLDAWPPVVASDELVRLVPVTIPAFPPLLCFLLLLLFHYRF